MGGFSISQWEEYKEFLVIFTLPQSAFWLQMIYIFPTCKIYEPPLKVLQKVILLHGSSKFRSSFRSGPGVAEAPHVQWLECSSLNTDPVALKACALKSLAVYPSVPPSVSLPPPAPPLHTPQQDRDRIIGVDITIKKVVPKMSSFVEPIVCYNNLKETLQM